MIAIIAGAQQGTRVRPRAIPASMIPIPADLFDSVSDSSHFVYDSDSDSDSRNK